jgi:GNAT superfamily N-acetyltransferase
MTITDLLDGIHLPAGVRPAPSWDPRHRERLADEAELVWLLEEKPEPPWVREVVLPPRHRPFKGAVVAGYSLDGRGDQVRAWLVSERSIRAYRELQQQGYGTCPIEAVLPWSLHRGLPSLPANLCGGLYPGQQADAVLHLWAMLGACVDGEKQGLSVGLPELVLSLM